MTVYDFFDLLQQTKPVVFIGLVIAQPYNNIYLYICEYLHEIIFVFLMAGATVGWCRQYTPLVTYTLSCMSLYILYLF